MVMLAPAGGVALYGDVVLDLLRRVGGMNFRAMMVIGHISDEDALESAVRALHADGLVRWTGTVWALVEGSP